MRIYQSLDGSWVFNNEDSLKISGLTLQEAETMSDKATTLQKAQAVVDQLAEVDDLLAYINAMGYGQGQSNAFTDDDAAALKGPLGSADVFNALNMLTQVKATLTNGEPVAADFSDIMTRFKAGV